MQGIQTCLGDCLRELRKRRAISDRMLAKSLGVSVRYVHGLDTGLVDVDPSIASKLREILAVSASELRRVRDWRVMEGRRELQRFGDTMQLGVDERCRIAVAATARASRNLVYSEHMFNEIYQTLLDKPVAGIFDEDNTGAESDKEFLPFPGLGDMTFILRCPRCGRERTLLDLRCKDCRLEFPDD